MTYNIRENISVVDQDATLLQDTFRKNIDIYNKSIEDDKINRIFEEISYQSMKNFVEQRIDFSILENSTNFSGGEKQKIVIVREILKNSHLYIMDEPTNGLDQNSIFRFLEVLKKISIKSIIIIISHDKRILNICNEIIDIVL